MRYVATLCAYAQATPTETPAANVTGFANAPT